MQNNCETTKAVKELGGVSRKAEGINFINCREALSEPKANQGPQARDIGSKRISLKSMRHSVSSEQRKTNPQTTSILYAYNIRKSTF